jgi:hypothetical protein
LFTRPDFLRPKELTIKEGAEYGYFIIKYIEKFKLDDAVGVGEFRPQVYFLPDEGAAEKTWTDPKRWPATEEELGPLEAVTQKRLARLEATLKDFWTVSA